MISTIYYLLQKNLFKLIFKLASAYANKKKNKNQIQFFMLFSQGRGKNYFVE